MTLEQLNTKYALVDRQKHFEIVDFFQANSLTIQNLDEGKDHDTLTTKMCLISDYAYALAQSGHSSKAIPFLKDAIRLQELHPSFINNKIKSTNYEFLVFELGRALHDTGNIDESKKVFEKLISLAPDNQGYRTWVIGTTNFKRKRVLRFVYLIFTIWLLVEVLFGKQFQNTISLLSTFFGLTLFGIWATLDIANFLIKRKYRLK